MKDEFMLKLKEKAREIESAAELFNLAKENDIAITAEEAAEYFAFLHPQGGLLSDEELDNVTGGCNDTDPDKICGECGRPLHKFYEAGTRYQCDYCKFHNLFK